MARVGVEPSAVIPGGLETGDDFVGDLHVMQVEHEFWTTDDFNFLHYWTSLY